MGAWETASLPDHPNTAETSLSTLTADDVSQLICSLGSEYKKYTSKGISGADLAGLASPAALYSFLANQGISSGTHQQTIAAMFNAFASRHPTDCTVLLPISTKQYNNQSWSAVNRALGNIRIPPTQPLPFNETPEGSSESGKDFWFELDPKSPVARAYYNPDLGSLSEEEIQQMGSIFTSRMPRAIDHQTVTGGLSMWTDKAGNTSVLTADSLASSLAAQDANGKLIYPFGISDAAAVAKKMESNKISLVVVIPEPEEMEKVLSSKLIAFYESCKATVVLSAFEDFTAPDEILEHKDIVLIAKTIAQGKNCLVHCMGGTGRTGTIVTGALANIGLFTPARAINWVHTVKSTYIEIPSQWDEVLDESTVRRFDDAETVAEMVEDTIEQALVQQRCADKSKMLYIPGLVCATDPLGLKVTGFVTGSSAASSALQIGDVVVEVKDELVIGLSSVLAFAKMSGDRDSEVALTAIRKNKKRGGKERISTHVLRDVKNAPSDCENASGNKARALKSSAPRALATQASGVALAPPSNGPKASTGGNIITKLLPFLVMIPAIYFFSGAGETVPNTFRVLDSEGNAIGEAMLSFEAAPAPEGAISSDFRVHVYKINGFPDSVGDGWGGKDTTDPYVLLQVGDDTYRTSAKDNGGGTVTFDEKITFKKHHSNTILKFQVFDKNMISDSLFGEFSVDLREQWIKAVDEIVW